MLNLDNNVLNGGGAISLQSGTAFPNGQVYGRFFNDTSVNTLYFDDGSNWNAIGGGGTAPTLDAVLTAGNYTTQNIQAGNYYTTLQDSRFEKNASFNAFQPTLVCFVAGSNKGFNASVFAPFDQPMFYATRSYVSSNNTISNANGGGYSNFGSSVFIASGTSATLNLNNLSRSTHFETRTQFSPPVGSSINVQYLTDYYVGIDDNTGNAGQVTIANRYGIQITDFRNLLTTYTNIYSIYSSGTTIPMYHAGIGFFGTLTNLATTNVAMSLGKPINFENSTSATAGGSAGSHLIVYVNGVQRKIALLLP